MEIKNKGACIGILIGILVISIIYTIVMFECYKNRTFIFTEYIPPKPPTDETPFYPNGDPDLSTCKDAKTNPLKCGVQKMTPTQIAQRDYISKCFFNSKAGKCDGDIPDELLFI
jgi:hypothetical protein